ncbi:uncharacterized protein BJX67DRAFT_362191 [Aspergillus lucknowensis]|uniref:FAD-binding PCMH-type domain-containing protein n=1 Tax=Aspergillus lucknowensis TaxID=176173 RepID=A0ABR4LHH3_9EURO
MAPLHLGLLATLGAHALALAFTRRASIASITDSEWDAFNATVSGRLRNGEPMLAPCYTRYNGEAQEPDLEQCSVLQKDGGDLTYATGQFGMYVNSQWGACQATGQTCTFGPIRPDILTPILDTCEQGSVPTKYVDAQSVEDVQRTLVFAGENSLRLVIKNTGHDYEGRSSAPDSLALWTHNMQPPIEFNEEFVPEGCSESGGDSITFGAGEQFGRIYDFVEARGYRIVGGSSITVGAAGGWITGGGHSLLTNELGLGVDNVQQLKAVLPNGTHVTANRCQNQDLFFALRGGGGGTFAVITEMTSRVYPKKEMQFVEISFANIGVGAQRRLMDIFVSNGEKWAAEGWGGYIYCFSIGTGIFIGTSLLNYDEAVESMKPLSDFATHLNIGVVNVTTTDSFRAGLQAFVETQEIGIFPGSAWALSSRIVKHDSFAPEKQQELSSILSNFLNVQQELLEPSLQILVLCLTMPAVYSQSMPESDLPGGPGHASISPHWRDGVWQALHFRAYSGSIKDPELVRKIAQNAHDAMNPLRAFTPDSGAYINEADPWEPDYINSFWGQENYERLLRIKREVDPENLLMVRKGVGWDENDGRFSCYPDVDES